MKQRLQKVMAASGVASRRGSEDLILRGAVLVNGRRAEVGQTVDTALDVIEVRGKLLSPPRAHVYLALHKPIGVVTTMVATHGELTIKSLLSDQAEAKPVGRLDKDTSGLLLCTSDGLWANIVTHPRYQVEKEYLVEVEGTPTAVQFEQLRTGVSLPDGSRSAPAEVQLVDASIQRAHLRIVVKEGKKRQIRLMCYGVGHPVRQLQRIRVGPVRLENLPAGQYRLLTDQEV